MNTDQFWSIIDQTTSFKDHDDQLDALDDLLEFNAAAGHRGFRTRLPAGTGKNLDVGSVGCLRRHPWRVDEDGFEYFQRWLISKGRDVFEFVLGDADELADIIPEGTDEPCEFEDFSLVAMDVWATEDRQRPAGRSVQPLPLRPQRHRQT